MAGTFVTQMTVPVTVVDTHHLPPVLSTLDPPASSISAGLAPCGYSLGGWGHECIILSIPRE